jgi:hemerythrin
MNNFPSPFDKHAEMMELLHRLHPGSHGQSVISRLIDHLSLHFVEEDRMMRAGSYPVLAQQAHRDEHYLIQDLFLAHVPRIVSGNISQEEIDLMIERLQLHIDTVDADMIRYIHRHAPELLTPK